MYALQLAYTTHLNDWILLTIEELVRLLFLVNFWLHQNRSLFHAYTCFSFIVLPFCSVLLFAFSLWHCNGKLLASHVLDWNSIKLYRLKMNPQTSWYPPPLRKTSFVRAIWWPKAFDWSKGMCNNAHRGSMYCRRMEDSCRPIGSTTCTKSLANTPALVIRCFTAHNIIIHD